MTHRSEVNVATTQGQQHQDHAKHKAAMHKRSQEMMKHYGKSHGGKSGSPTAPAPQGHDDHKVQ